MNYQTWDAVIIGGGAAGLSAAQMLGRARRRTLVIDAGEPRNRFAAHMHGILGHDGLDPRELLARGRAEAARYGVRIEVGTAVAVRDTGADLSVRLEGGATLRTRAVVIASGIRDALPSVPGLAERWGREVLHCPYCHGYEVADGALGVLVASDRGIHQLELVRQWSADITAFTSNVEPLDDDVRARLVARGIRIVEAAVTDVDPDGVDRPLAITTADGARHPLDALFVAPDPVPGLGFADALGLARTDAPGSPLAVDAVGATSHPRVWAIGGAVAPAATVPVAMAGGCLAGGAVNAALVADDVAVAVSERARERARAWEARYATASQTWSGRVNAALATIAGTLTPGKALDVGCGEGGDALWLATEGWHVVGVDVSATAVARAAAAADERGLADLVAFTTDSIDAAAPAESFDLVTSCFLHSWEDDFPRIALLRLAADRVAPGGHLLIVSHAAPPPWAQHVHDVPAPRLRPPDEELRLLALDPTEWTPRIVEVRRRDARDPDGAAAVLEDGILLLQRSVASI